MEPKDKLDESLSIAIFNSDYRTAKDIQEIVSKYTAALFRENLDLRQIMTTHVEENEGLEKELDNVNNQWEELKKESVKDKKSISFYQDCLKRLAEEFGIMSPLILISMAKNDKENYFDILLRHIKETRAKND